MSELAYKRTNVYEIADEKLMKEIFEETGNKYGVKFLYRDFREGFRQGQQQARELGLYRQKYCGCIKSLQGE